MCKQHYIAPTHTYYGLATSTYRDTRRTRHITDDEYDALSCGQQAGFEFECDLDNDAREFMMNGRTLNQTDIDFEPEHTPDLPTPDYSPVFNDIPF